MWLTAFTNGERPGLSPDLSPPALPGPLPASFICPLPKALPEGGENLSPDLSSISPPRAREKIELVPNFVEEEDARTRESLSLTERRRLLCSEAFDVLTEAGLAAADADVKAFIAINEPAAQRLVELHGEQLVLERWHRMLEDLIRGNLDKRFGVSIARLERQWDSSEAYYQLRRNGHMKAVESAGDDAKKASDGDRFTSSLRASVKRGSEL